MRAAEATNGRVARLTVAPSQTSDVEHVDDPLDDLVSTVDDLVRDLAVERVAPSKAAPDIVAGRGPPPPESLRVVAQPPTTPAKKLTTRFVVGMLLIAVIVEFVLLNLLLGRA